MFSLSPASQKESINNPKMREMNKRTCLDFSNTKQNHFGDNLEILTLVYRSGKYVKLITFSEC